MNYLIQIHTENSFHQSDKFGSHISIIHAYYTETYILLE